MNNVTKGLRKLEKQIRNWSIELTELRSKRLLHKISKRTHKTIKTGGIFNTDIIEETPEYMEYMNVYELNEIEKTPKYNPMRISYGRRPNERCKTTVRKVRVINSS